MNYNYLLNNSKDCNNLKRDRVNAFNGLTEGLKCEDKEDKLFQLAIFNSLGR